MVFTCWEWSGKEFRKWQVTWLDFPFSVESKCRLFALDRFSR
jgi:hypothetical protein